MKAETLEDIGINTGFDPDAIADMDWDEIDAYIERRIGKKLQYDKCDDSRLPIRSSVLLMLGRLIDPSRINKSL